MHRMDIHHEKLPLSESGDSTLEFSDRWMASIGFFKSKTQNKSAEYEWLV